MSGWKCICLFSMISCCAVVPCCFSYSGNLFLQKWPSWPTPVSFRMSDLFRAFSPGFFRNSASVSSLLCLNAHPACCPMYSHSLSLKNRKREKKKKPTKRVRDPPTRLSPTSTQLSASKSTPPPFLFLPTSPRPAPRPPIQHGSFHRTFPLLSLLHSCRICMLTARGWALARPGQPRLNSFVTYSRT